MVNKNNRYLQSIHFMVNQTHSSAGAAFCAPLQENVRPGFNLRPLICFGETVCLLALSNEFEHACHSHPLEHLLFFHMVIAKG